jgi:hypothetical protein
MPARDAWDTLLANLGQKNEQHSPQKNATCVRRLFFAATQLCPVEKTVGRDFLAK